MILSKRLQAVANLVPKSQVVADIGCDHAHVAIYLMQNHIAGKVIACDVNKGPLAAAENNIREAGLLELIETRLSDGMSSLGKYEADAVIIAGMGGPLMMNIVSHGLDRLRDGTALVLQPQSEIAAFRHFLYENGLDIQSENMIFEDGKYYPIIMAKFCAGTAGTFSYDDATEGDYEYGKLLIENRNKKLFGYLEREHEQLKEIRDNLTTNGTSEKVTKRLNEVDKKIALNRETAGRYV